MTRIGRLRHRVELQTRDGTDDDGGGQDTFWRPLAVLWARLEPVNGSETVIAGRLASTVTHAVTLRHRFGVEADQRLVFTTPSGGTRHFEIVAVVNVNERNRWLRCYCEERDL